MKRALSDQRGLDDEALYAVLNHSVYRLRSSPTDRALHPDAMIAAIAITQKMTLVTRNLRDFEAFKDLAIERW